MIKVFYDDKCNLCSREIEYYKKISKPSVINWCKLSQNKAELEKYAITYIQSLKMLHAVDSNGKLHIGIDAFIAIWQQLEGWKWIAKFISIPGFYQVSKNLYRRFANWRFNRLTHCVIERIS
jgi:predicted DCC family thiol-disulfide oxidoreductase YuxK